MTGLAKEFVRASQQGRRRRVQPRTLAIASAVAAVALPAMRAHAVSVLSDPLNFEPQRRSDTGVYLESRAQVTASGMRNGFQANFANRVSAPGNFPNAGIESVFYYQLPALAAGETVEAAGMWFSSLRDSAATAVTPTFNVDFYAMGFEKSTAPHTAPIDMSSTGVQSNYAQSLHYVGPNQVGATWTPALGPASPVVKIQDDLLTPSQWIAPSNPAGTNGGRQTSTSAELDLGSYIQTNLYGNLQFTPNSDFLTVRMNPDVNMYNATAAQINQRYQVSANQTDPNLWAGLIKPTLHMVIGSQWDQDNSTSTWSSGTSWLGTVPNATDRSANFGPVITAPQTVNVDAPQTVGMLKFNNANAYTLAGSQITLEGIAAPSGVVSHAAVSVLNGSHTVSAPIVLNSDVTFAVTPAASTLTVANLTATGKAVGKTGAGSVSVGSSFSSSAVAVTGGTLKLASNATATRYINTGPLSVSGGGKLDITDNKLFTTSALGTESGGTYSGVQGLVQSASNGGAWDGPGLTTSMPDAVNGLTSIGVATGEQILGLGPTDTALFNGQTITGASTVAMYTYAGDANLDGFISGDDYASIDGNVSTPGADGWYNGDFNYDGIVSGDDYAFIDGNIVAQGAPFPTSGGAAGLTAVPEPASLGVLGIAAASLLGRRRRR